MAQDYLLPNIADTAEGNLDSGISAAATEAVLESGDGASFPVTLSGNATSLGTSQTLNATGIQASLSAIGITTPGFFIRNITDGSHAFVVAISTNSLTTTQLRGGSDNTWQSSDEYVIGSFIVTLNTRDANGNVTSSELALVKTRSSDTLQELTRAYDGSVAKSWDAGTTYVSVFVHSRLIDELQKALTEAYEEIDSRYTKSEIDALLDARNWKDDVRVATTAAGTLASDFENGDTIDGIALATGDRVLIKDQASASENGIYTVNASGAPTRATDFDEDSEVTNAVITVKVGTVNADKTFICTSDDPSLGVDDINFSETGGGLSLSSTSQAQAASDDVTYMSPKKVGEKTGTFGIELSEDLVMGVAKIVDSSGQKLAAAQSAEAHSAGTRDEIEDAITGVGTSVCAIPGTNKFVHVYGDSTNIRYSIISIDPVTLAVSKTTPASIGTDDIDQANSTSVHWDPDTERVVLFYANDTGATGECVVGEPASDWSSITWNTAGALEFDGSEAKHVKAVYDTTNNAFIVFYEDFGDSGKAKGLPVTITGGATNTAAAVGSPVTMASSTNERIHAAAFGNDKTLISYQDAGDSSKGKMIVATFDGATLAFGSEVEYQTTETASAISYDTVEDAFLLVSHRSTASSDLESYKVTIAGTVPTASSEVAVDTSTGVLGQAVSVAYAAPLQKHFVIFDNYVDTNLSLYPVTITGSTPSVGSEEVLDGSTSQIVAAAWNPTIARLYCGYRGDSSDAYGIGVQPAGDYYDIDEVHGVTHSTDTSENTVQITLVGGGIVPGFSGKTIGAKAYMSRADGSVIENGYTGDEVGRFVSATELFVTKNP